MRSTFVALLILALWSKAALAQLSFGNSFTVVPLGTRGGADESNLSAYLVAVNGSNDFICLDAGTVRAGIDRAVINKVFHAKTPVVLRDYIKGYLISHAHLDHVAGLVLNSPDDAAKNIYGLPACLDNVRDCYFSWKSWANFADQGDKPTLGKYHYVPLAIGEELKLTNTEMFVKAFPLSHAAPYQSSAFLLRHGREYLLYLGDTGADKIEGSDKLKSLWQQVAPLVAAGTLKGIFIEVSYPDEQPRSALFGHLTPTLLMEELGVLNALASNKLKNVPIVITHIKPLGNNEAQIRKQLAELNSLGVELIFARQAKIFKL